jgi:hypothetical protein
LKSATFVFLLSAISIFSKSANAAQIPNQYMDAVVAIGLQTQIQDPNGREETKWVTEGTGFFYGVVVHDDPNPAKRLYETYLVTARHVVEEHVQAPKNNLQIRLNPKDPAKPYQTLTLPNRAAPTIGTWFLNPKKIDVAIVKVNFSFLHDRGFDPTFFPSDTSVANTQRLKDIGVAAGDDVFVLGFPMNLAGEQRNYVIVRQGVVARISEMLDHASPTYLIDSLVFPGNSGGPVILKGETARIEGAKSQNHVLLAGLVVSYIPYFDVAISEQTHRERIVFEENSGLADVIPTDAIDETIAAYRGTPEYRAINAAEKKMRPARGVLPN